VLERGMPRFFRRLAEGVFDIEDLKLRTAELADFITASAAQHTFSTRNVIAVGFSNGANIAGALLLLRPDTLGAAVLFRAMVPLTPETLPKIQATPVLISNGKMDPLVSAEETERLAALLRSAGADVTTAWQNAGHELTDRDVITAREWLALQLAR
jgi:predicted esterase